MMLHLLLILSVVSLAHSDDDFCYVEKHCDPYAWGDSYPSCHPLLYSHHSPINLNHELTRNDSLDSLHLEGFNLTHKGQWKLRNQGHSVVLEVGNGMQVSGAGLPGTYRTVQLHFHWGSVSSNGSEHTLDNMRFPMEMHIVNIKSTHPNLTSALEDETGLAVLGVFIDVVFLHNENFQPISSALPSVAYKGQTKSIRPFPLIDLLPQNNLTQYYRYHGSLTTPPCSQVVLWTIYEVPIYISWTQFEQFVSGIYSTEEEADEQVLLHNNYRHIHLTYSRTVYASKDAKLLTNGVSSLVIFQLLKIFLFIVFVNF
ncbi:carbonic anhydrase 4-like [Myxocyprinus asiaticus]|uniref:carbonic anhydrase 4-like n=1 Tax=Myxocyprinus asiaticus TaxID=70543 RepID=UPI002221AEB4|nr:carbonic anhydrase 4-like [Myxocyprinus asiaticus]